MTEQERLDAELEELEPWLDEEEEEDTIDLEPDAEWQCIGLNCLHDDPIHARSECYTAEMIEDFESEQRDVSLAAALDDCARILREAPTEQTPELLGVVLQAVGLAIAEAGASLPGEVVQRIGDALQQETAARRSPRLFSTRLALQKWIDTTCQNVHEEW